MNAAPYWPDLSLLPTGWRIAVIEWHSGRCTVRLENNRDYRTVDSSGNHRAPAGAFNDALAIAKAEGGA